MRQERYYEIQIGKNENEEGTAAGRVAGVSDNQTIGFSKRMGLRYVKADEGKERKKEKSQSYFLDVGSQKYTGIALSRTKHWEHCLLERCYLAREEGDRKMRYRIFGEEGKRVKQFDENIVGGVRARNSKDAGMNYSVTKSGLKHNEGKGGVRGTPTMGANWGGKMERAICVKEGTFK